jgi:hypothetical protein
MRRLGLGVEAQHAVPGEGGDGPLGVAFALDQFDGAVPGSHGQRLDEFFFDPDTALASAGRGLGVGFGRF